jgi:hypothetical protein
MKNQHLAILLGGIGLATLLAFGTFTFFCCGGLSLFVSDVKKADELFAQGKQAEAVAMYKRAYPNRRADRDRILKRIVQHELSQGNKEEARIWAERGMDDKVTVAFEDPTERRFWDGVAAARESQLAAERKTKEEQEAAAKREKEEREAARRKERDERAARERKEREAARGQKKWTEGGTLHGSSALDWQNESDRANKLATCGDFLAKVWADKRLSSKIERKISGVDDLKPFAQELADFIDEATKKHPDPARNRQIYVNQTVAELASAGMISMGWLKDR